MSESAVAERLLPVGEIARRLSIPVSTAARYLEEDVLQCVRRRRRRNAYESQVDWIVAALNAHRSGSIEGFAQEWKAQRKQAAPAPAVVPITVHAVTHAEQVA